jgi:hypothetical protein
MLRFLVKLLLLFSTLLFGIILGIQQAEQGIFSLMGNPANQVEKLEQTGQAVLDKEAQYTEEQENYYVTKIDDEQVELSVVAQPFTTQDLLAKQQEFQERNQRNMLSTLGTKVGDVVYSFSRRGAEWFVSQLEKAL